MASEKLVREALELDFPTESILGREMIIDERKLE